MYDFPYYLIGPITGIIGAITGMISLIWHINNNKSKLKLDSVHFTHRSYGSIKQKWKGTIEVEINLRNLSNRSTTIENITIQINNLHKTPFDFKPTKVSGNSSIQFKDEVPFSEDFEIIGYKKIEKLGVFIKHTFGVIHKVEKVDFSTGYFTIC